MSTDSDTTTHPVCIDVRTISPPARHPLIFSQFDALGPGEHFEIVNDHDPLPLYFQYERASRSRVLGCQISRNRSWPTVITADCAHSSPP